MPLLQYFFVENRLLGTASREYIQVHAELHRPHSYAFFCPVCAELWARCPVEDTVTGETERFMVWSMLCQRTHPKEGLTIPGSLHLSWDEKFNEAMPEEVIKREFEVHLNFIEREGIV